MDFITYAAAKNYTDSAVSAATLTGPLVYKGSVQTKADLPKVANLGDVYNVVEEMGKNFAWNGADWDDLGGDGIYDAFKDLINQEKNERVESDTKIIQEINKKVSTDLIAEGEFQDAIETGDDNNRSLSQNTATFGASTIAGSKGYKIIETGWVDQDAGTGYYVLRSADAFNQIAINDEFCVLMSTVNMTPGMKVISKEQIGDTTKIVGDNYIAMSLNSEYWEVENPRPYTRYNAFILINKPWIGDIDFGFNAVAFGQSNIAYNNGSIAGGLNSKALGKYSLGVGSGVRAGHAGLAANLNTTTIGINSVALNNGTTAAGADQTVVGKFNKLETDKGFIVGNGTSSNNKSNAFAVDWNGNAIVNQNVYVNGVISEDNRLVTMKELMEQIGFISTRLSEIQALQQDYIAGEIS